MKTKYAKVYKNDTFANLLFQYSCDRMDTDPKYRASVRKAVAERKFRRRERDAARIDAARVSKAA